MEGVAASSAAVTGGVEEGLQPDPRPVSVVEPEETGHLAIDVGNDDPIGDIGPPVGTFEHSPRSHVGGPHRRGEGDVVGRIEIIKAPLGGVQGRVFKVGGEAPGRPGSDRCAGAMVDPPVVDVARGEEPGKEGRRHLIPLEIGTGEHRLLAEVDVERIGWIAREPLEGRIHGHSLGAIERHRRRRTGIRFPDLKREFGGPVAPGETGVAVAHSPVDVCAARQRRVEEIVGDVRVGHGVDAVTGVAVGRAVPVLLPLPLIDDRGRVVASGGGYLPVTLEVLIPIDIGKNRGLEGGPGSRDNSR